MVHLGIFQGYGPSLGTSTRRMLNSRLGYGVLKKACLWTHGNCYREPAPHSLKARGCKNRMLISLARKSKKPMTLLVSFLEGLGLPNPHVTGIKGFSPY